jgi:hypothetical protein
LVASFIENLVGAAGAIDIGCIILVCKWNTAISNKV